MEFSLDLQGAEQLVGEAQQEPDRLTRHLLLAAAISLVTDPPPTVVGGTAEQFWSRDQYVVTDLDMCGALGSAAAKAMRQLGFRRSGRYWELEGRHVLAVEFPEAVLAGDEARVVTSAVRGHEFRVIGIDDLYLDRLRQATATPYGDQDRLAGAYALLATRGGEMDFGYIQSTIGKDIEANPLLASMVVMHRVLRDGWRKQLEFPAVLKRLRDRLSRG